MLRGQWHLDEGARCDDSVGGTPDSSGNGLSTVVIDACQVAGRFGTAFRFYPADFCVDEQRAAASAGVDRPGVGAGGQEPGPVPLRVLARLRHRLMHPGRVRDVHVVRGGRQRGRSLLLRHQRGHGYHAPGVPSAPSGTGSGTWSPARSTAPPFASTSTGRRSATGHQWAPEPPTVRASSTTRSRTPTSISAAWGRQVMRPDRHWLRGRHRRGPDLQRRAEPRRYQATRRLMAATKTRRAAAATARDKRRLLEGAGAVGAFALVWSWWRRCGGAERPHLQRVTWCCGASGIWTRERGVTTVSPVLRTVPATASVLS